MNRRKFLAVIGASPTAPLLQINSEDQEIGPVLFVQAQLIYRIDSEVEDALQSVHIDNPPGFITQRNKIKTTTFSTDKESQLMKNKSSLISYNGMKEFSENIPDQEFTTILPVNCGNRGQATRGIVLDEEIEVPQFGVRKVPPKQIQVDAFGESIELRPSEQTAITGEKNHISAKLQGAQDNSKSLAVTPVLSVSNNGIMMPYIKSKQS